VSAVLSSILYAAALSYYHYLNFLGYSALPFLQRTEVGKGVVPVQAGARVWGGGGAFMACNASMVSVLGVLPMCQQICATSKSYPLAHVLFVRSKVCQLAPVLHLCVCRWWQTFSVKLCCAAMLLCAGVPLAHRPHSAGVTGGCPDRLQPDAVHTWDLFWLNTPLRVQVSAKQQLL
jgi:hypothetical protein